MLAEFVSKMNDPPTMNYSLEFELQQVGRWSNMDVRIGSWKCDCDKEGCDHKTKPCDFCSKRCTIDGYYHKRPSTLYEKLCDADKEYGTLHSWLLNRDFHIKRLKENREKAPRNVNFRVDPDEERVYKLSILELKAHLCIIKFQMQAYRKIIFPDEHRLIWSDCPICKQKRFFYRVPEMYDTYYPNKGFYFDHRRLSKIFHCMKCHYIDYESDLDIMKIHTKAKDGLQAYLDSKAGMRVHLQNMGNMVSVVHLKKYYIEHELHLKDLPVEKFFIITEHPSGGIGYQCIVCKFIYKRKNMAEIHRKKFWNWSNEDTKTGCIDGLARSEEQMMAILA